MNITELKKAAEHHIKRGDSMQMDPKVILELCEMCEAMGQGEPVAADHSGLIKRIDDAIDRVTQGRGLMSIPADPRSDVDLVLSECKALLQGENPPFWATDFHPAQPVQHAGAQSDQRQVIRDARVDSSIISRAMEHPTVLEIMAACAEIIDTESSAVLGADYDGTALRATAKRFLEQAQKIRASDLEIWGDCPVAGLIHPAPAVAVNDDLAKAVHYPDCWDVAAYPTLADALCELATCFQCCECVKNPAVAVNEQMLEALKMLKANPCSALWHNVADAAIAAAETQIKDQSK